jgi:hypothetical protein|tara:strand:- start:272 stop:442 length:171 start_codon:yes stop_codon:yes gene_type:complete
MLHLLDGFMKLLEKFKLETQETVVFNVEYLGDGLGNQLSHRCVEISNLRHDSLDDV